MNGVHISRRFAAMAVVACAACAPTNEAPPPAEQPAMVAPGAKDTTAAPTLVDTVMARDTARAP